MYGFHGGCIVHVVCTEWFQTWIPCNLGHDDSYYEHTIG